MKIRLNLKHRAHLNVPRLLLLLLGALTGSLQLGAQNLSSPKAMPKPETEAAQVKGEKKVYTPSAWTLAYPLGQHEPAPFDTIPLNYQRQAVPSLQSVAYATTGNLGTEGENMIFFRRQSRSEFFFADALRAWIPSEQRVKFFNVYIPNTQVSYNTGGGKQTTQDRLKINFAGNVNRRVGIGAMLDYIYSKGSYDCQATKDFMFGFRGYYRGDRYEMQAFFNHWNMLNKENGGITDRLYITDPAVLQGGVDHIDPKSIPVNLNAAHSRVNGARFFMNNAFNVGYWRTEEVNDTLTRDVYVPVTKFIWTLDYRTDRHVFHDKSTGATADSFWRNSYLNRGSTHDDTHLTELDNTLGIEMIEGFRTWAKFGLSVYATYRLQKFVQPEDSLASTRLEHEELSPLPDGFSYTPRKNRNLLYVGGRLSKTRGSILTYGADLRAGIAGDVAADIEAHGHVATRVPLLGDTVGVTARAHFLNTSQPYLLQHYFSNHFAWNNDFGKTRSFRAEGEVEVPWTRTRLSAGVENIQNYVYFDSDGLPRQHGGNVQVISARLEQKLRAGIWNWDNTIVFQHSSKKTVLPLPELSIYSNMYLNFDAFRVLRVQLGVDCDYYTKYYAPSYQPATMSFVNQDKEKIGNYPFMNVYLTCRLSKVRFYVMMSHINQGWFSRDYFSMPLYPLNPRRFQIGLSVDFLN